MCHRALFSLANRLFPYFYALFGHIAQKRKKEHKGTEVRLLEKSRKVSKGAFET